MQAFIEEECLTGAPVIFTAQTELYRAYNDWCVRTGVPPKASRTVTRALQATGIDDTRRYRNGHRTRGFLGIQIDTAHGAVY